MICSIAFKYLRVHTCEVRMQTDYVVESTCTLQYRQTNDILQIICHDVLFVFQM